MSGDHGHSIVFAMDLGFINFVDDLIARPVADKYAVIDKEKKTQANYAVSNSFDLPVRQIAQLGTPLQNTLWCGVVW